MNNILFYVRTLINPSLSGRNVQLCHHVLLSHVLRNGHVDVCLHGR